MERITGTQPLWHENVFSRPAAKRAANVETDSPERLATKTKIFAFDAKYGDLERW
jgi:hypothetical protein